MKIYSFILFALCAISTIPEIYCEVIPSCTQELKPCRKNEDCCSQNCQKVDNSTTVCFPPLPEDQMAYINATTVYNVCSYVEPTNETASNFEYSKYGYNAAHGKMNGGDAINVTYQGKSIIVHINDLPSRGETTLELSKEAATALNITGITNCTITDAQVAEEELDVLLITQVLIVTFTLLILVIHI